MASKEEMKAVKPASVYSKIQMAIEERDLEETPLMDTAEEDPKPEKTRKPRKEYTKEEIKDFQKKGMTAGRKGAKMRRINLSITEESFEFVEKGAKMYGLPMTYFINGLILDFKEKHPEIVEAAEAWDRLIGKPMEDMKDEG